jgi:outer membrane lipoprotein SlyB
MQERITTPTRGATAATRLQRRRSPLLATLVLGAGAFALLAGCAVPVRTTRVYDPPPPLAPVAQAPAPAYVEFGYVRRIDVVETRAEPTGGGAVIGAVVGGVIGNAFGSGGGRAAATAIGAVGGAVIGNEAERQQAAAASDSYYRVVVRMEDGRLRRFNYRDLAGLRVGDRVRVQDGQISRA